jgi:hypothetical protein
MAVIRIEAQSNSLPKSCPGRKVPVADGRHIEFQDATEEELAFWNVLDDKEKADIVTQSYTHCFFDVLNQIMQREAEKGKKLQEREFVYANVQQPSAPPNSPPNPESPNEPPIQGISHVITFAFFFIKSSLELTMPKLFLRPFFMRSSFHSRSKNPVLEIFAYSIGM